MVMVVDPCCGAHSCVQLRRGPLLPFDDPTLERGAMHIGLDGYHLSFRVLALGLRTSETLEIGGFVGRL